MLGIDTGGTYTDAVVVSDEPLPRILTKAKALTTHHDLTIGITEAMRAAVGAIDSSTIGLVSISTTLATNAIVEGRGGRVCLISLGFSAEDLERGGLTDALGDGELLIVAGGHTSHGDEAAPLDLDELDRAVDGAFDEQAIEHLAGFAVAGQFAVRNPAHEQTVRDHLRRRFDVGVTCSHELSARLNGPRRAVTSVLNARLVGLIGTLVAASQTSMHSLGIDAPLMVVRGDGSLIAAELACERPVETILSGPAASVIGAQHLARLTDSASRLERAIVADIGGTTTDLAVLADGEVQIGIDGAIVGGHHTMIEAVDIHTIGLGGDSEVNIDDSVETTRLRLGPRRVVPVSLLASMYPDRVQRVLADQARTTPTPWLAGQFAVLRHTPEWNAAQSEHERSILDGLAEGPVPLRSLLPTKRHEIALKGLVRNGLVARSGFTPTDAAHVLGLHDAFHVESAWLAAELLAQTQDRRGVTIAADGPQIARLTIGELRRRTAEAVMAVALINDGFENGNEQHPLIDAGLRSHRGHVAIDARLSSPLVALGASARTYYPEVATALGADLVMSEHADVANAIGAIVGTIRIRRQSTITQKKNGAYIFEGAPYVELNAAMAAAEAALGREVNELGDRAGADTVELSVVRADNIVSIAGHDYFVDATITVTGSGRPFRRRI